MAYMTRYKSERVNCGRGQDPKMLDKMLNGAAKNGWQVVAITPFLVDGYTEYLVVTFGK